MTTFADKRPQHKSNAANALSHKQSGGKATLQFSDNRPEAIMQKKLQQMAGSGTQISQLNSIQKSADDVTQCMSWQESKSLVSSDYNDPVSDGVSGGGVWMYVLKHVSDPNYDIRVHYHAGSSKGSKAWTVRWNNEDSGNNIATQKWMRDRVNVYYESQQ